MEFFATANVAFVTSLLLSVFRMITCQDLVQTPATVSVTEGDPAIISCLFDQTDLVALNWKMGEDIQTSETLVRLFKGRQIPGPDPRFSLADGSSLSINETTQADSGIYWCQVTLQGVFQSSTNLTILPVVTTLAPTPSTTTKPLTRAPTTKRTAPATAVDVDPDVARHAADSAPVMTTPAKVTTKEPTVKPTKSEPNKQISNNSTLYIIVGSCAGVVALAILVLVCYCCCCRTKTSDGYSKANPNTPV